MKNETYVSIPVGLNSLSGDFIFKDMMLGNIMNHEGIHITDNLLNGMAIEKRSGVLRQIMYSENNILFYKNGKTFTMDVEYPISEKKAMDEENKLNIINKNEIIKRKFYSPNSIKNVKPLF